VNVEGGAIARGYPIGTTGAVLNDLSSPFDASRWLKRGIVTICIGGGQGIALDVEMIA
jgi:acetyl-CoA C-acetyltransferase